MKHPKADRKHENCDRRVRDSEFVLEVQPRQFEYKFAES